MSLPWSGFTLPLVFDLRPGTVRWRFVSERQWDKELLIEPNSSSLRLLLIRESKDICDWSWFPLDITEAEIAVNFLDFDLILKVEIGGGIEGFVNGILGLKVLEGFKLGIQSAMFLSVCVLWWPVGSLGFGS